MVAAAAGALPLAGGTAIVIGKAIRSKLPDSIEIVTTGTKFSIIVVLLIVAIIGKD